MTTLEQSMDALRRANEARSHKSSIKERLATVPREDALLAAADIFWKPGPLDASWTVRELVEAIPGFGKSRVRELARYAQVAPGSKMRSLSVRQRHALANALAEPQRLWPGSRMFRSVA